MLLSKSCAISAADFGTMPELVPNVLRFELTAATVVVVLGVTRGSATEETTTE